MINLRATAVAFALLAGACIAAPASATPVAAGGLLLSGGQAELAQWQHYRSRRIDPRRGRCWWENRRIRDHRGRWVVRRVQVCQR